MAEAQRPTGFSTNFQREVQAMLFLFNWKMVTGEEIRKNLPKLGMELIDEPRELPNVPAVRNQYPADDSYPIAEQGEDGFNQLPEDVEEFIQQNQIPDEIITQLPIEAFSSVQNFMRHLNIYAQSLSQTESEQS